MSERGLLRGDPQKSLPQGPSFGRCNEETKQIRSATYATKVEQVHFARGCKCCVAQEAVAKTHKPQQLIQVASSKDDQEYNKMLSYRRETALQGAL